MSKPTLHHLLVGAVRPYDGWHSAIRKEVVNHPLWLSFTGLAGDAVGDTHHHGGPEQAVLAYGESHYAHWKTEGFRDDPGAFGENLLLTGISDQKACIGDVFEMGDTRLQISCPRSPCNTLARYHGRPDIIERVYTTGRGGWYFRVLQEGFISPGQELKLMERPHPQWSVARALQARWRKAANLAEAHALAEVGALNPKWRTQLLG